MKILESTTEQEVRKQFALCEVDSPDFKRRNTAGELNIPPLTDKQKEYVRRLLNSNSEMDIDKGIVCHKHGVEVWSFDCVKKVKIWYKAILNISEMDGLMVICTTYWKGLSHSTYKLKDAAENPGAISREVKGKGYSPDSEFINTDGIILVCSKPHLENGPWRIIEGHKRLLVIYNQVKKSQYKQKELKVFIGVLEE